MAVIKWSDGREFPLVQDFTVRQLIEIEKALKSKMSEMGEGQALAASLLISLREGGIALDVNAILDLKMGTDFTVEEDSDEEVPTTTGAEAGSPATA